MWCKRSASGLAVTADRAQADPLDPAARDGLRRFLSILNSVACGQPNRSESECCRCLCVFLSKATTPNWPQRTPRTPGPLFCRRMGMMRTLFVTNCAILGAATILAASPAWSQAYDPAFPVCLQTYGIAASGIDCSYTSLAQCAASASGRAAQCLTNPFFAHANAGPPYNGRGRACNRSERRCF